MAEPVEANFAAFDGSTELAEVKLRQCFSVEEIVALFARIRFFNSIVHGSGTSTNRATYFAEFEALRAKLEKLKTEEGL